jgi:hypothetical protein
MAEGKINISRPAPDRASFPQGMKGIQAKERYSFISRLHGARKLFLLKDQGIAEEEEPPGPNKSTFPIDPSPSTLRRLIPTTPASEHRDLHFSSNNSEEGNIFFKLESIQAKMEDYS